MKTQHTTPMVRQLTGLLAAMLILVATACTQTGTSNAKAAGQKKILIVLSAAKTWTRADGTLYPTGYWAEEFVVMHQKFVGAGYDVDLTTPGGVSMRAGNNADQYGLTHRPFSWS